MRRWSCGSRLTVTSSEMVDGIKLMVRLVHNKPHCDDKGNHIPYHDVSLPGGAAAIIREHLEWSSPSDLVPQVQAVFPQVTAKQIHHAWRQMSEEIWKWQDDAIHSAQQLLKEFHESANLGAHLLDVDVPLGVEIVAFSFPKVIGALQENGRKFEEIGLDATCEVPVII